MNHIYDIDGRSPVFSEDGDYWVAPTAVLIGDVVLESGASVWFGAILRGDNERISVGQGSNVQENSVLHTDMGFPLTIGAGCTIGHRVMLHGCTIGDNSLIGMGATVLNGAKIGKNCLIGAGALVTEGKTFPDNSLIVGSPAKAIKTLDDSTVAMLKWSADHYVENYRKFAAGLKRLD